MPNKRLHFLYDVYTRAPPAGVILSRISGGKIGRKTVFEEILEEPSGVSYFDNQIMRESGVKGMKPMDEAELERYIKAWLRGVQRTKNDMSISGVKDEMNRIKEALIDSRANYEACGGDDTDIVGILDELDLAYKSLSGIFRSLKKDEETDFLEELELRRDYEAIPDVPENDSKKAEIRKRINELVQKRKRDKAEDENLKSIRQAQDLSKQSLEDQWVEYLTGLIEELHLEKTKFDPASPKESFRMLLRDYMESSKSSLSGDVSKYLKVLSSVLAPIVDVATSSDPDFAALDQLISESSNNAPFMQLLSDIKGYYEKAFKWKQQAVETLAQGKEVLRKFSARIPGTNIDAISSVGELFTVITHMAENLEARVAELENQLAAVTQQLRSSEAMVVTQKEAMQNYEKTLRDIASTFLTQAQLSAISSIDQLLPAIKQTVDAYSRTLAQTQAEQSATQASNVTKKTILSALNDILIPYAKFLQDFFQRLNDGRGFDDATVRQVVQDIENIDLARPGLDDEIRNSLAVVTLAIRGTAEKFMEYGNVMLTANSFLEHVRRLLRNPSLTPDQALITLDAVMKQMDDYNEILQDGAKRIENLAEYMKQVTDERNAAREASTLLEARLKQEQEANALAMGNQQKRLAELEALMKARDEEAAAKIRSLEEMLAQNKKTQMIAQTLVAPGVSDDMDDEIPPIMGPPSIHTPMEAPSQQYRRVLMMASQGLSGGKTDANILAMCADAYSMVIKANSLVDSAQASLDSLQLLGSISPPTISNKLYSVWWGCYYFHILFMGGLCFKNMGSTRTPAEWTKFLNQASLVWSLGFGPGMQAPHFTSASSCARLALNMHFSEWAHEKRLPNLYNNTISQSMSSIYKRTTALDGQKTSGYSERMLTFWNAARNRQITSTTYSAWMQDIKAKGFLDYCTDFFLAAFLVCWGQEQAGTHETMFHIWQQASKRFMMGSQTEGLPLGAFILRSVSMGSGLWGLSDLYDSSLRIDPGYYVCNYVYPNGTFYGVDVYKWTDLSGYIDKWSC